jgi:serine/threonine protein kinase
MAQPEDPNLSPTQYPTGVGQKTPSGGVILGGNELKKRVGQGGMGEVWVAWDVQLHRNVALKTMRPDWAKSPDAVARFYTEARSVAKLNHPNIVQIYQIGEQDNLLFFTMEWVEGESLDGYMKRRRMLELGEAIDLIVQMVDGLAFAHEQQVIHRDVKPANCLLDKQLRLKIADFGLAKMMDSDMGLTSTGVSMGSPNYMSPEMAKGEAADHRADMYAVGLTFYQMLTGEMAFTGPTATAVLLKQVNEDLPITEEFKRRFGPNVVAIIRKMAAKRPEDRYQTYAELRGVLVSVRPAGDSRAVHLASAEDLTVQIGSVTNTEIPRVQSSPAENTLPMKAEVVYEQEVRADRKKPLVPLVISAAAVIGVVGVLVLVSQGRKDQDSNSSGGSSGSPTTAAATPAPALPTSGTISGELSVADVAPAVFAGQEISLYDDIAREQIAVEASQIATLRDEVQRRQGILRQLLRSIRDRGALEGKSATFAADIAEVTQQLEEAQTKGGALFQELERLRAGLTELETKLAEFQKLGHSSLPIQDPVTGRSLALSATEGKKQASIGIATGLIEATKRAIATKQPEIDKVRTIFEAKKAELAALEERATLMRSELTKEKPGEMRRSFASQFQELVPLQQQLVRLEEKLEALQPASEPVATVAVSSAGTFDFSNVKPGRYTLKFTGEVPGEDDGGSTNLTWVEDLEVPASGGVPRVSLGSSNLTAMRNQDDKAIMLKPYKDAEIISGLQFFLSPAHKEDMTLPFEAFAQRILER